MSMLHSSERSRGNGDDADSVLDAHSQQIRMVFWSWICLISPLLFPTLVWCIVAG